MKIIKKCLVILRSPTHVIASLCAINTLNTTNNISVDIISYNPAGSDDLNRELVSIVQQLSAGFPFIKNIKTLTLNDLDRICGKGNETMASIAFKRELWGNEYQELYYPNDVMGFLYQLACITYKDVKTVCYGDGLGAVTTKQFKLSLLKNKELKLRKTKVIIKKLRHKISSILYNNSDEIKPDFHNYLLNKVYVPDQTCLIIPIDYSGSFIKKKSLVICKKHMVMSVINQMVESCVDLNNYIESLLLKFEHRKKVLLLTENFAEAERIDFENEIAMWCAIIKSKAEKGSVIFLKSHPGELLPRNRAIKKELSGQFEVVTLNKEFSRHPIELWEKLVLSSRVLCMSYPCISLKYLFGIDVVNSFNNEFIESWFPEFIWKLYKNNSRFFSEPVAKLEKWDGKSVLWNRN